MLLRAGELEHARSALVARERLSVLGQVTSTVSHELRNPLGVIRSSVFYLQKRLGAGDEKVAKHLERIEQQVAICNSVIDDLLEFTRGRSPYAVSADVNAWLQTVIEGFAAPQGVRLGLELAPGLPLVSFDPEKMQRVIENLFENALQSIAARTEAEGAFDAQVTASTRRTDDAVCLALRDNGAGMTDETLLRAFDPLFTTRARGTGLGLAIVRKIVEEHGARIALERNADAGVVATIWFPLTPGAGVPHQARGA
jgi:signal transduction histidine kinase